MRRCFCAFVLALALGTGALGCGDDDAGDARSPSALVGLDAVPRDARVVLVADVARLAKSALVDRAISEMLARDPGLKARFAAMSEACGLDFSKDIERALVGLGDAPGEVVLVAKGSLSAARLASCAGSSLREGGGNVTAVTVAGRGAYHALSGDGRTDVWFAQTGKSTVVAAASEGYLAAAIGKGPKIEPDEGLGKLLGRAKDGAGLRFAGRIPPEVGRGIVTRTAGDIHAPPEAVFGHLSLADGVDVKVSFLMASAEDAETAATVAPAQLAALAQVAQARRLGPLVEAIELSRNGEVLHLSLALSRTELSRLLAGGSANDSGGDAAIDSGGDAPQNPASEQSSEN